MPVVPIRNASLPDQPIGLPAIRTPDQFRNAEHRIKCILDGMRSRTIHNHLDEIDEIKLLREALDASPFIEVGERIVSKGFLPRSVA